MHRTTTVFTKEKAPKKTSLNHSLLILLLLDYISLDLVAVAMLLSGFLSSTIQRNPLRLPPSP